VLIPVATLVALVVLILGLGALGLVLLSLGAGASGAPTLPACKGGAWSPKASPTASAIRTGASSRTWPLGRFGPAGHDKSLTPPGPVSCS